LLSDLGNCTYYIPGPYGNLNELPVHGPMAEAEAETEFAMEAALTREETLLAEETPAPPRGDERYGDKECELDDLASVDESATRDETMSDTEFSRMLSLVKAQMTTYCRSVISTEFNRRVISLSTFVIRT